MLLVKHPLPACRQQQQAILDECPGEDLRFYQLAFSMGNIYYRYYNEAKNFKPTAFDYQCWLLTLSLTDRKSMEKLGFDQCRKLPLFKGYIMSRQGIEMEDYVLFYIEPSEHDEYKKLLSEWIKDRKGFVVENPAHLFHYQFLD